MLRGRVAYLRRIGPRPAVAALTRPDAVLISHAHFDHLDVPSLRLVGPCPVVAPRGCGRLLERAGVRDVREIAAGERVRIGAIDVSASPLSHDGRRSPVSRARLTLGYLVDRTFFAGDTDLFEGMGALAGEVDVALLPVWGWGPRLPRGHMDPEKAARAAALLGPRVAIPIHWGTLAAPRVRWLDDPAAPARAFARHVDALAPGVEVRVLSPGESTDVTPAVLRR